MRDGAKVFLSADWRHLAMLNYEIEPAALRSMVPPGTELDSWEGTTFVSLVGFRFLDTRVLGIPIPFHRDFDEVNLRFYVRHRGPEGWRRGVVFVKEIVPRLAIATLARWLYNEPYVALPMRSEVRLPPQQPPHRVEYGWRAAGSWCRLGAAIAGAPALPRAGSQEEFITEHYWGYTAQRLSGAVEYRVEHPQWRVWCATESWFVGEVAALYGARFVEALSRSPASAFVADGSRVAVRFPKRIS